MLYDELWRLRDTDGIVDVHRELLCFTVATPACDCIHVAKL